MLDLAGDVLGLALVGSLELLIDHLESELVLVLVLDGALLLKALLDGWGRGVGILLSGDLDLEADSVRDGDVVNCGLVHGLG